MKNNKTRRTLPEIPSSSPYKIIIIIVVVALLGGIITYFVIDSNRTPVRNDEIYINRRSLPTRPLVEEIPEPDITVVEEILDAGITHDVIEVKTEPKRKVILSLPEGTINPQIVLNFIRSQTPQVRHCYERALRNNNALQGSLVIETTIHPSGDVLHTRVTKDTILDRNVTNCVVQTLKNWKFPQPQGGVVTVAVPFNFTPKAQ